MSSREQFEIWGCSDRDLSITLKCETYAGIAWLAWQAATNAMEAKCAALAAENAGLKKYICDECYVENIKTGATKCAGHGMPETPATDSSLAEVRAQGAEECVRQLVISGDDDFSDAPNVCAMVAHQLRKGVQS